MDFQIVDVNTSGPRHIDTLQRQFGESDTLAQYIHRDAAECLRWISGPVTVAVEVVDRAESTSLEESILGSG